jgi:hypothetical protein
MREERQLEQLAITGPQSSTDALVEQHSVSKHRHERFLAAYAALRIDDYPTAVTPHESLITVKEVWLPHGRADSEVARLNALNADKGARYVMR